MVDHNKELELKYFRKIVMLFMILGARRKQALFTIHFYRVVFKDHSYFSAKKTLKQSKPTRLWQPYIYNVFTENKKLCVTNCLLSYLERQETLINHDVKEQLILYGKPHRPVGSDTSTWI